jgi:prophage regulatory protein
MTDRIIREAEAARITGLSRSARFELTRLGKFPKRVSLTERTSGYLESEINEWIASRKRVESPLPPGQTEHAPRAR